MGAFGTTILLGSALLIVAIQCGAGQKTETVQMTPEMRQQFERFIQDRKDRAEKTLRSPVPEAQPKPKSERHQKPSKSALTKAFKSASNAAKNMAKGAVSAYKNVKIDTIELPPKPTQPQKHALFKPSDNFNPSIALANFNGHQPVHQLSYAVPKPEGDKSEPSTHAQAREAMRALFSRAHGLTRQEVLAHIDTLKRFPDYEQMKSLHRIPIDLDVLTAYNQTSEAKCEDKKYMKKLDKMHKDFYYSDSDFCKALVPFLKEVLTEQLALCDFNQRSIDEFANFANEDPNRWEMIKLWKHKVGHWGKLHKKWGDEDQYSNNGIQLNEALDEIMQESNLQGHDQFAYGYKLITALRAYCAQMDRLRPTLDATRRDKEYRKSDAVKELHRFMSVCEQTKNTNYMQALGGMTTTYYS